MRIAETDVGMLNSIGLANPGHRPVPRPRRCRGSPSSACRSGSPSAASRRATTRRPARGSTSAHEVERDRAQPLLPERRRGAGVGGGDRRGLPRGDDAAALREALAGRCRHRRGRPRRRRPPARTASRSSTRSAAWRSTRTLAAACSGGDRRLLGPGARSRSRSPRSYAALSARTTCRSSAWAACRRAATRSSWSRPARRRVALGTVLFARSGRAGAGPRGAAAEAPSAASGSDERSSAASTGRERQPVETDFEVVRR